jgi:uncharacterized protein YdhG (YjbR/CyaY superfamily)
MADTRQPKANRTTRGASNEAFSDEEKEAMRERAREVRRERTGSKGGKRADGEADVLARIAEMPAPDRVLAERIHAIVREVAPELTPKTWYGMPAYARDGKAVCFFQGAAKFKSRYATLGFNDGARLDDGEMWPTAFALVALTPSVEARIAGLVRRAADSA